MSDKAGAAPIFDPGEIAQELLGLLGTGRQVAPVSTRFSNFAMSQAYEVVAEICRLRRNRGEKSVGRKIGFTNQSVWQGYGIAGPIWNYMFDTTVQHVRPQAAAFLLSGFPEPRIEPELVLCLAHAPEAGMSETELIGCVEWVASGFELVSSVFPGWSFTAADAAAAFGVHAGLLVGRKEKVADRLDEWKALLPSFTVTLAGSGGEVATGKRSNVLGGPLQALGFLVEELARHPHCEPLAAGEIVTTGTLTLAFPARSGEWWTTEPAGIAMQGLRVTLVD